MDFLSDTSSRVPASTMDIDDRRSPQQDSTTRSHYITGGHPPLSSTALQALPYPNFSLSAVQVPSEAGVPSASHFSHPPIAPSQAGNNSLLPGAPSPTGFVGTPPLIQGPPSVGTLMGGPPIQRPPLQRPPIRGPPMSGSSTQTPPIQGLPVLRPPLQRPPIQRPPILGPPIQGPPIQGPPLQRPPTQRPSTPAQCMHIPLPGLPNQGPPIHHPTIHGGTIGIPPPQSPNQGSSAQGSQSVLHGLPIHGPPILHPPLEVHVPPLQRPEVQESSGEEPPTQNPPSQGPPGIPGIKLSLEHPTISSVGVNNPIVPVAQQRPQIPGFQGPPKARGGEAVPPNSGDSSGGAGKPQVLRPLLEPPAVVPPHHHLQGAVIPSVRESDLWYQHSTTDGQHYYAHSQTKETMWEKPANARIMFQPIPVRLWSQHRTPEGKLYYYNHVTQLSVWEKPQDFDSNVPTSVPGQCSQDEEKPIEKSDDEMTAQADAIKNQSVEEELQHSNDPAEVDCEDTPSVQPNHVSTAVNSSQLQAMPQPALADQSTIIKTFPLSVVEHLKAPPSLPAVQLPLIKIVVKEEPQGPRPVKSIPIAGTPWSIVWSSDNRRFFFDATNRVSVWNVPKDLEYNPSVLKIVEETADGKKRVGESVPSPEAKRLKADEDEPEEDDMDTGDKTVTVEDDQIPTISSEGASILDEAKLKTNKSLDERQREFKEMLLDRGVSAFSTWEKELPKFVFDPRCKLLTVKERKTCFEQYILSRADEERKERKSKLKEKKENFRLLLEEAKLHPKSNFSDFAFKYGKDARFKGVEKMRDREQIFSDYLVELKKASKQKEQKSSKYREDLVKREFMGMLTESDSITHHSQWKTIKSMFDHDPRYKAVESSTVREEWFIEYFKTKVSQKVVGYDRQERIQASLKEREREVKLSRFAHEKEWSRERDQLRKTEALQHFKALLVDMVRNPEKPWHDVKRNLRQDHRWELASLLDTGDKEKLFQQHVEQLVEKKRVHFRQLLEETPQISLTMSWRKVRKLIKDDPRYKNYGESDHRREAEYSEYVKDRLVEAKNEFRALLRETKAITYRSYAMIKETDKHHKDIVDVLKNDQRYLVLECIPDERTKILDGYLEELHRNGPPPPPTATNPGERLKRPAAT